MSYLLAAGGFVVLIILHELGHFTAAKAVGMRVERFALFFPPYLMRKKVGETEYAIGAIPAGGLVKISGMTPAEDLPDEVRTRAYYSQPVWKRIVTIVAGPAVNFVLAFLLMVVFFWQIGPQDVGRTVNSISKGFPAQGVIHPRDELIAVDGHAGTPEQLSKRIAAHRCAQQPPRDRCRATTPATLLIERDGRRVTLHMTPVYDAGVKKMRLGFSYANDGPRRTVAFRHAIDTSTTVFWKVTKITVTLPVRLFDAEQRKQVSGVVGIYETTRQTILQDPADVVWILSLVSLSLAVLNMFPFLPLDGGHVFWAIVEKVRHQRVSYATMERSGMVGFALVLMLFFLGLSNDIGRLTSGGFNPP